jgi:hypothetical protein
MDFITLQTNSNERRTVSIALSDKRPQHANLLGALEHQTEFTRADLVAFAHEIIKRLA